MAKWIEQRAFESSRMATDYVQSKLTDYLKSYLKNDGGWQDFKKSIEELLENAGLIDKEVDGKKLKPYHVETIFVTEAQTAANYGRFSKQIKAIDIAPMWEYVFVDDDNHVEGTTCDKIAKKGGLIMPADWPGWRSIYPPNHFRCRSGVVAIPKTVVQNKRIKPTWSGSKPEPEEGFGGTAWDWK